jgi:excisionase family DNA binding protein
MSTTTGNPGLDALADAIAERVLERQRQQQGPRLMTISETAEYLKLSKRTIEGMISRAEIAVVRQGKSVRLDRRVLDRWIDLRTSLG